jgi:hypothetical protein
MQPDPSNVTDELRKKFLRSFFLQLVVLLALMAIIERVDILPFAKSLWAEIDGSSQQIEASSTCDQGEITVSVQNKGTKPVPMGSIRISTVSGDAYVYGPRPCGDRLLLKGGPMEECLFRLAGRIGDNSIAVEGPTNTVFMQVVCGQ